MASGMDDVLPSIPAAPRTPSWPPKASVEPVDSEEGDQRFDYTSTDSTPTLSSRGSVSDMALNDDEDVEEVVREGMIKACCLPSTFQAD